ncbi:MAG: hypothetical protein ACYDAG_17420 [Chloroflexota bacterium]
MELMALLAVGLVGASWFFPRIMAEHGKRPHHASPSASAPAGGVISRLGRSAAGRVISRPSWQHSGIDRRLRWRLDVAGLGAYTVTDLLAMQIGYGFVLGAVALATALVIGGSAPPLWLAAGFVTGVWWRWRWLVRRGKVRQLACRLEAPRFASLLRSALLGTGAQLRDAMGRLVEENSGPFYDELHKAIEMSDADPAISLEHALIESATRMGSPGIQALFVLLTRGAESGVGNIEELRRFAITFRATIEHQVQDRAVRLTFVALGLSAALGLPAALLQIMDLPMGQLLAGLHGLL